MDRGWGRTGTCHAASELLQSALSRGSGRCPAGLGGGAGSAALGAAVPVPQLSPLVEATGSCARTQSLSYAVGESSRSPVRGARRGTAKRLCLGTDVHRVSAVLLPGHHGKGSAAERSACSRRCRMS